MTHDGYYPKKLIYLGDSYRQVAVASGAEFVDINDIKIIGRGGQPTVNENNRGENDGK